MDTNNTSTRVRAPDLPGLWTNAHMTNHHLHDEPALNLNRRADSEKRLRHTQPFLKCSKTFNICSYNAQTLNQSHSLEELCLDAKRRNLAFTAIQEHRFCHDETIKSKEITKEFTLITTSATRNSINASVGGVGFLFHNKVMNSITKVQKISNRIIKVDLDGNPATTLFSCYSPTNMSEDSDISEFYNNLTDAIENTPLHNVLLICGDFNAKVGPASALFTYNKKSNRNGTYLLDLMNSQQLFAANLMFQKPNRRLWTFRYPNGAKSQLDYILIRKKWSKSIRNINAITNVFGTLQSDHRALIAQVQLKLRSNKQHTATTPRPNFKLLHGNQNLQSQYAIAVKNRFSILSNSTTVDHKNYPLLGKVCTEIGAQLLPHAKPDRWKNIASRPSVIKARQETHQAIREGSRSKIIQKKKKLQEAYTTEETNIINAKTKELEENYFHNQHSKAWKIIRELSGTSNTSSKSSTIGTPAQEKRNWFNHFSKLLGGATQSSAQPSQPIEKVIEGTLPIDTSPFRPEELDRSINKSKVTDVGPDNIPLQIWTSPLFKNQLLHLCNETYQNKLKPSDWSKSNIIPIHKKGNRGDPANYRGISLNSIAAKLYNRMLLYRIQPYTEKILSWTQAGFRKSRSTLSNILAIRRIIEGMKLKNLPLTMVFVDLSKAFDSIKREEMFKILEAYGFPKKIIQAIKIIYENNTAAVITPVGLTDYFNILTGIFQGDTLAPLLFIIVIDYILRKTFKTTSEPGIEIAPRSGSRSPAKHIRDLSYADDITLLAHSLQEAQNLLSNLEKAALQVGLKINDDKTKVMSINNPSQHQLTTITGAPLENTSSFKYLGSYIPDSDTDFNRRKAQAWTAMGKLKVWKSNITRECKIRFFQASVESILI